MFCPTEMEAYYFESSDPLGSIGSRFGLWCERFPRSFITSFEHADLGDMRCKSNVRGRGHLLWQAEIFVFFVVN